MNNYEDRTMNHKRVRMEGEGGAGVVQGNGLPLNYMDHLHKVVGHFPADNGHQVYGGAAGAYGGGAAYYGGEWSEGYGARLPYAPPAHQPYQQPPFLQHQQHLHMAYEPQRHHALLAPHHAPPKWAPPAAAKPEPPAKPEPQRAASEAEEPKIKIKTDLFKEETGARPALAPGPALAPAPAPAAPAPATPPVDTEPEPEERKASPAPAPAAAAPAPPAVSPAAPPAVLAPAAPPATPAAASAASAPAAAPACPPDAIPATPETKAPGSESTSGTSEGKRRGRPKGSTNKPKPPELQGQGGKGGAGRGAVGRPRGATHSAGYMRPFKRDFSGIRFRRRWSDDELEPVHIPNEVYFGDVPVPMEVLYNYYDTNTERDKLQQQAKVAGNVTLVYSSSDSSSDESSDSDSTGSEGGAGGAEGAGGEPRRRPGRPRGSKTVNRRSDGPRTPSVHSGDKPAGVTDMKRFLKAAGVAYDYTQLVDGCGSNKERVARLLGLLRERGLQGEPTLEACRALYSGPAPRRRGPKPGSRRGPRKSAARASADEGEEGESKYPVRAAPVVAEPASESRAPKEGRRVTRGQTSGKPRQRIVISSDEEDSPLSKLRTIR